MKMSGLAAATELPVATLKFYLREGLLHPGRPTSKTQAEYDDTHVARVRLIRALGEVGGLELSAVRRVLDAVDDPEIHRLGVLRAAQHALYQPDQRAGNGLDVRSLAGAEADAVNDDDPRQRPSAPTRAEAWAQRRGWTLESGTPALGDLDRAWAACAAAGIGLDEERMDAYAEAAVQIAATDLATVPDDQAGAVRQVVLGTVLVDPVISALRRLAQQHLASSPDHQG